MSERLQLEPIGDEATVALPETGMLIVGSAAGRAALVLSGQGVEGAHCAIGRIKSGGWAVKDLGSRYGTLVNGNRITSHKLEAGDLIVLGSRRLQVVDPAAPAPALESVPEPVAKPVAKPVATPVAKPVAKPGPSQTLPKITGYRVERLLGRGGMGQVYLAVQESLSRPVALKLLTGKYAADTEFVKAFQAEARSAAAWNHPNVVVVHDVGDSGGLHFLSMEYMPGGNLEQVVASQGPLSWRRVLEVLHDAAGGLAYAEAQGILHRDIKPANLMLSDSGSIKIADLGLATQVESQGTEAEGLGGKIYGTPHFISPEQARGDRVDHRSDLYSLGATAYRLLSGQTPFQGETTREIVIARFTRDPVSIAELVPEIPRELDALVMRLMAREPDERFASAEELQREVDRLRMRADHGEPVVITEKPKSRLPLLVGAAAIVLVAGGLAVKMLLAGDGQSTAQADESAASEAGQAQGFSNDDESFFGTGNDETNDTDSDELDLENLNLRAQVAYHEIPSAYTDQDRIDALRELAASFDGTDTASRALQEAGSLETELQRSLAAEKRLSGEVDSELQRLRTAVKWPPPAGELPRIGAALQALAGFRPLAGVAFDPRFVDARDELAQKIVSRAEADLEARLEQVDELASAGNFAGVGPALEALLAAFDLPPHANGELSGLSALRVLENEIQARRDTLGSEELAFHEQRRARERQALGAALGPGSGFAGSLRALELDDLLGRLGALGQALGAFTDTGDTGPGSTPAASPVTRTARTAFEPVYADVQRARQALSILIDSFAANEWRRKAIADPRPRHSGAADIIAVDAQGLTLSIDGQAESLSWAAFGDGPEVLEQLFKGRLSRSYTAAEDAAIASLLRLAAVGQVTALAEQLLDPAQGGILQPAEAKRMQAAFGPADEWLSDAGAGVLATQSQQLQRERKAADILAQGLMAAQANEVSLSVASFERLFQEYGDTLTVLLLSDGSGWRQAPATAPAPTNGAGSESGAAGSGTQAGDQAPGNGE